MITSWSPDRLAHITGGAWHNGVPEMGLCHVEIDHRELVQKGLFVALAGANHDGHDFVSDINKTNAALVSRVSEDSHLPQLCVADVFEALHDLARAAMAETKAAKIAVTGSVGKTSTKQALHEVLSHFGNCHASKGNYNNHIGAPLSMVRTPDDAEMIIMEMGMNHAGEISPLSQLFDGDIAIITKIADSHIGHFESVADIAKAKSEIFDGMSGGIAILPRDDAHFALLAKRAKAQSLKIISFGTGEDADYQLVSQHPSDEGQELVIMSNITGEMAEIKLGLSLPHHATTAMIIIAVLEALSLSVDDAAPALANLKEVKGRGNQQAIKIGEMQALFIDDSYNAGPASLSSALSYVASLPHKRKGLVITDMLELGAASDEAHHALIPLIEAAAPEVLILVGPALAKIQHGLRDAKTCHHFANADEACKALAGLLQECDLIFVKGSNGSGAPQLATFLSSYSPSTVNKGAAYVS